MPDMHDEIVTALESMAGARMFTSQNEQLVPSGERPCPICRAHMRTEVHGSVTIDVCTTHGVWLDNGELSRLLILQRYVCGATCGRYAVFSGKCRTF